MTLRTAILLLALPTLPACQQPVGPIFPEIDPPIVWPAPPDRPRIRYVGALVGEKSLKAPSTVWEQLGEVLTGPTAKWQFSTPTSVAVQWPRVFVTDGQLAAVFILDLEARASKAITHAGPRRLEWPIDVTMMGDRIVVADSRLPAVLMYTPDGRLIASIDDERLKRPAGVTWVSETGRLWVLDAAAHACHVFDRDGTFVRSISERGRAPGAFNFPSGITWHPTCGIVVADAMNFRVQLLDPTASAQYAFGQKGDAAGDFALPRDVAVDSEGHIYVLDNQFENVQIFDREGRLLMAFGREGRAPGEFYLPSGITIDNQDRIWIADSYNRRVQVFQYLSESQEETQDESVEVH